MTAGCKASKESAGTVPSAAAQPVKLASIPNATRIPEATKIDIRDMWVGLGPIHEIKISLVRSEDKFSYRSEAWLVIGNDDVACQCGFPNGTRNCNPCTLSSGEISESIVVGFLNKLASRPPDPVQSNREYVVHSDDFPKATVTLYLPNLSSPIRAEFTDQQRRWMIEGTFLAPDAHSPAVVGGAIHQQLDEAYSAILDRIGVREQIRELWIKEEKRRKGEGGR